MKAAICTAYGPPEVLQIREVDRPVPKDNELLIKVMASAVNSGDARIRGLRAPGILPLLMRFMFGFSKPRSVLGFMFSGVVEEVGDKVEKFQPGDKLFGSCGMRMGAHAEYVALEDKAVLALNPKDASFEEAAAILFGGMTALYFLRKAGIESLENPKLLLYGATGSVGTAAVEIAKYYGAHVTAVCSKQGEALAKSLGSDRVVIYTEQDFRKLDERFDIVFDAVGKTSKKDAKPILTAGGQYQSVGGLDVAKETVEQVDLLKQLFETRRLHANIDRVYPLDEIVATHAYVDTERKKGNVVLRIGEEG